MVVYPKSRFCHKQRRAQTVVARAATLDLLESRQLLSTVVVTSQWATPGGLEFQSDPAVIQQGPATGDDPAPQDVGSGTGLNIVLKMGPQLSQNPMGIAAFSEATSYLEGLFSDPITVVIDAELAPMANPNIIASTSSSTLGWTDFNFIRNYMVADAAGTPDASFVSSLPDQSHFHMIVPSGTGSSFTLDGMVATTANLKAMGVPASFLTGAPASQYDPSIKRDMAMTFNSNFAFDYTRSDGIEPGEQDFVGIAIHEMAHGLGFVSAVDNVDSQVDFQGQSFSVFPRPLDLFRLRPGNGSVDFTKSPRVLAPGDYEQNQVFYDGGVFNPGGIAIPGLTKGDVPLSTGVGHGDGNQASHWKDNEIIGRQIGIMDPTAGYGGKQLEFTAADARALDLIGWDLKPNVIPDTGSIQGVAFNDRNGDGIRQTGESVLAGRRIFIDLNHNLRPDDGEPVSQTDANGRYFIPDLPAGTFSVVQILPSSRWRGTPDGKSFDVVLASGQAAVHDFGSTTLAKIVGAVYNDFNGNGGRNSNDTPRNRRRVYLDQNGDGRFESTEPSVLTDAAGKFAFLIVDPGSYTVRTVDRRGITVTAPHSREYDVTLKAGQVSSNLRFLEHGQKPTASTGLHSSSITKTSASIDWTTNSSDAELIRVLISQGGGQWVSVAELDPSLLHFDLSALSAPLATYQFMLRAENDEGSEDSTVLSFPDYADATGAAANGISSTAIQFSWSFAGSGHVRFQVQRQANGGDWVWLADQPPDARSLTDAVSPEVNYVYRVRAIFPGEQASAWATTSVVRTSIGTPTGLTCTAVGQTSADFQFRDNSQGEDYFEAYESRDNGLTFSLGERIPADHPWFTRTDWTPWTTYLVKVRAIMGGVPSDFSNVVTVTTQRSPVPNAPTGLVSTGLTATTGSFRFNDNSTDETSFQAWESTDGGATFHLGENIPANHPTFVRDWSPNRTYIIKVRAMNGDLASDFSNPVTVTTRSSDATPPSGLHLLSVGSTFVKIAWTESSAADHYEAWISKDNVNFSFKENVPYGHAYTDQLDGLSSNTKYYVKVFAVDAAGRRSTASNTISFTTTR